MPCKIYVHTEFDGRPDLTLPTEIPRPEEATFGTLKQSLLTEYAARYPQEAALEYGKCCFWNQDGVPIPDRSPVAAFLWEHNDFVLRPLSEDQEALSALQASRKERGELSYYYAHDRRSQAAPVAPQPAPSPAPTAAVAQPKSFNPKQSPFGTDITSYETISSYTWEDHDGGTVKVLLPLDGVGKLPPEQVRSRFDVRAFELLIDGYNGRNLRFACYKTHGEMTPEECKHVVRANRINLVLRKAKEKDIWFDLFKKKAIGDNDDP
mmetsp:Transcript_92743/g.262276  ORF Transcript_92743/g.262276 Transcript_92743/m.262276 type:complete len:265 (-) Transcript_92743:83-877(-)|eukprot:CAMPEP_0168426026 /NCGR_PEP_ID=MMETSP0228-20121227/35623_1 /TAXON_ID=133427 /ORGANISM="Protoceratium reticulatum, Strain CCCM 535 (=CCMP 1889)" /LENGTH=264 /DNA_ID=CAMNT_0008440029 /DNA_START=33 /DNA_END=827 /DNA_ORIENTATION=-